MAAGILVAAALLTPWPAAVAAQEAPAPPAASDAAPAPAQTPTQNEPGKGQDLTQLSLEELMNVNVETTSVARKPQSVSESAAAVYVLTAEDIRRSGATSIPEALRMVPGLEVARVSSNTWAISARGFNGQFSNKLLVLIDGRSVYTPIFSGVYWDVQDLLLQDVERIEVIRGPGATLWGANAVNGVINIITKSAKETQGGLVTMSGGLEERAIVGMRYGLPLSDSAFLRVYGKWSDHDGLDDDRLGAREDDWQQARFGFRGDWKATDRDDFTLEGDTYRGWYDGSLNSLQPAAPFNVLQDADGYLSGGHVLGRWGRALSKDSAANFQVYYDKYHRTLGGIDYAVGTWDLDCDHRFQLTPGNDVVWGLGFRGIRTDYRGDFNVQLVNGHRFDDIWSAFVQDEAVLVPDRLKLTLGSKFELNDYTGFEFQPNGRLAWTPSGRQTYWGAVSRAVRTPSLIEEDGIVNFQILPTAPLPTLVQITGNHDLRPEQLLAYEAGWRYRPDERVSFDLAAFFHDYRDLVSTETGTPAASGGFVVVPLTFDNRLHGNTWGAELASEWHVLPAWTLHGGYTFLHVNLKTDPHGNDTSSEDETEHDSPRHQVQLRSLFNLTDDVDFDVALYYVDALRTAAAEAYVRGDVRLAWRMTPRAELELIGQNLFHDHQREFASTLLVASTEPETGVFLKLTCRF